MDFPILLTACVDSLADPACLSAALGQISDERREKAMRYRQESDRRLSVGAALLLREALRRAGYDPDDAVWEYGTQGKPSLRGCPYAFSLSHAGNFALCAVADRTIGCDLERIVPCNRKVAERIFSAKALGALDALPPGGARDRLFTRLWVLTESLLKATGDGLAAAHGNADILLTDPPTVLSPHTAVGWSLREYDLTDGYLCAVCAADPLGAAVPEKVDLAALLR